MTTPRRTGAAALVVALLALAVAGCGTSSHTTVLSAQLSQVDQALSVRNFAAARSELSSLSTQTRTELASGTLTSPEATRILGAISALSATLPAIGSPNATGTPTPQVSPSPSGDSKKPHDKGHGHPGDGGQGNQD